MKRSLLILLTIASLCSLIVGLTACARGKTAYDIYKDTYFEIKGDYAGVLSEEEWLDSLHGVDGRGIKKIDIVCGDLIIYFDDDSTDILKSMLPEAGHNWNSGVVTTTPTCISPGINTYTCEDCKATKNELLDSNGEHHWGDFSYDNGYHWRTCKICGEVEKHEHDFGEVSAYGDVEELIECQCGIKKTVGAFFSFKVDFKLDEGVSIVVYNSQDYSVDGVVSQFAYARDGDNGTLLNNGDGQVNFEVVVGLGYKLKSITITPSGYKNLKDPFDTGRDNTYRITKITSDLTVTVEAEIDSLDLPVMVINTKNSDPILDKENYVNCAVSVLNADEKYCFNNIGAGIRGRGNTTWGLPKKPYKLKFDSKINLFGNGSAKKWTLIANYADPSLLRNFFAYSIAGENGILNNTEYTTTVQNVELYLNGEYCGVYLLCEQNEVGSTRVNIDESLTYEDGSIKVNTGYLLEADSAYTPYEGTEGLDFFKVDGESYAIKSPDTEDEIYLAHKEEFIEFIKNIIQTAVDNLNNLTNSPENYAVISELLDIPSFVDGYLIDELTNTADGCFSSFYLYYDNTDGKIHRGPIWDYDASCGNAAYVDERGDNNPEFLRASLTFWYDKLLKFEGFKQAVKERLIEISESNAFINFLENKVNEIVSCSASFNRNFEKWDGVLGQENLTHWNTETIISMTTWREQFDYLVDWLKTSYNYLISVYCT